MTNQSYAQVTIACNTVESPILQEAIKYKSTKNSKNCDRVFDFQDLKKPSKTKLQM